ncbi:scavenger receptor cysteine-rich type 1 protein M130-like [Archocentrus centrarchus]|uniref:scavenger receptor cysteine-rich type 1 protein M130-like n=1 Tax=Archocentrus centrarchus TaxID=63155 RepID=UPI0011E9DB49|nr:scavenger receptor cysteine-rich type 1 protein M130-like [Archocentrus centrarchus]
MCSGVRAEGKHNSAEFDDVRLVGGVSRCAGTLEVKHLGQWRPVDFFDWTLKAAAVVCAHLHCGSASTLGWRLENYTSVWKIKPDCVFSGSALMECATSDYSPLILDFTCSDSVRLLNGSSLCSGRLEVKSNQSWSSVCEADFDQQDAEVVCRELGCGPPSVLQGALYGEVEAPVWSREFQCGGRESALLDCRSSGSARNSCSPGKAVGLTCSEPDVRLVGGASRCAGTLQVKYRGSWRPVDVPDWTLKEAAVVYLCSIKLLFFHHEYHLLRPAGSANHFFVLHGRGLRGAAGASGVQKLQFHHQLLHPATVPRRLLPPHL